MARPNFRSPELAEITGQIGRRVRRGNIRPPAPEFEPYSPGDFEHDMARLLTNLFPYCVLSGVRIFSSKQKDRDFGYEVDNTLHIRSANADYIIIVEAKKQPVRVEGDRWWVEYGQERSCCRDQVETHIRTLWEYLGPLPRDVELKIMGIVVSSDSATKQQTAQGYRNADIKLCSVSELPRLLEELFFLEPNGGPASKVFRISESGFLDLLRLGQPVEHLGHPELLSAVNYVERCRRFLDERLFDLFKPTAERWAINGSAGMGKSVLLAYAAAVLSSGYKLYEFQGDIGVVKATDDFATMKFAPANDRTSIAIMAMSTKQLNNLQAWFAFFSDRFRRADTEGVVRFRPPQFILCRDRESFKGASTQWAALLVDEAHDLPPFAAKEIATIHNQGGLYLVVACDRHQKLRLGSVNAKIIDGLDFGLKSSRLRQIYRNPAPIYIASLAIMFRWFAKDGPKTIPTLAELREQFGFEADRLAGSSSPTEIKMMSDAHPANSWCHTVASFPDIATAFRALAKENLGFKDVLWVRFSTEDPDFDYEQINQRFTYHVCPANDAGRISDKYIKGQDYPIVVVEGFPDLMDKYEAESPEGTKNAEAQMWTFRRELYLCASRATSFLYFVCNVTQTIEALRIQDEIGGLVEAMASPRTIPGDSVGGTKSWRFSLKPTSVSRNLAVYSDTLDYASSLALDAGKEASAHLGPDGAESANESEAPKPDISEPATAVSSPERPVPSDLPTRTSSIQTSSPAPTVTPGPSMQSPIIPTDDVKERKADVRPMMRIPNPATARNVAPLFGEPPIKLVRDLLIEHQIKVERDTPLPSEIISKICEGRGFRPVFETN